MNGKITTEELTMLRDYILLPYMLTLVQKSVDDIEHSPNLLKQLYLAAGQAVINRISKDMRDINRELTKRNIKIISDEHSDFIVYHHYYCRGYQDRFGMTRDVMRSEISTRLGAYVAKFGAAVKEQRGEGR
ncbi:hypothetical protein P4H42_03600 [Paenibacillus macerans]|uniref:hypothetical protein n=1 Tax=Paenibacillus macerans TaxID=44252 RepID=UPI002DB7C823|nr:hypothetical protein [Paenibacillus macerans]MEC0328707.1 hypothetical protein [Paenibacillus macerans]